MKKRVLALAIIALSYQGSANADLSGTISSILNQPTFKSASIDETTNTVSSTSAAVASQVQPSNAITTNTVSSANPTTSTPVSTTTAGSTTSSISTYDPASTPSINPVNFQSPITNSTNGKNIKEVVEDCLTDDKRNAAEVVEKVKAQGEGKKELLDGMKSQDAAECFKFGGFDLFGLGGFSFDGLFDKLKAKACAVMQQEINVLKNQVSVGIPLPYGMGSVGMRPTGDGPLISQSTGPTVNLSDTVVNMASGIVTPKVSGVTTSIIKNTGIGDIRSTANNSTSTVNNSVNNVINSMSK
jgi:hypothetical protein